MSTTDPSDDLFLSWRIRGSIYSVQFHDRFRACGNFSRARLHTVSPRIDAVTVKMVYYVYTLPVSLKCLYKIILIGYLALPRDSTIIQFFAVTQQEISNVCSSWLADQTSWPGNVYTFIVSQERLIFPYKVIFIKWILVIWLVFR